jgi:ubiquinone/menaquinone biosynthesis C-methylase UbiE
MIRAAQPDKAMRVLDFGCGTGLVTLALAPLVKEVIAADSSQGMLDQLSGKLMDTGISNVRPFLIPHDGRETLPTPVDLVLSSMTMHHIADVSGLIKRFRTILNPGGQLCIADLEVEDGSFHDDPTGIEHHGFSSQEMERLFREAGFSDVRTVRVMDVEKQRGGDIQRYPVNLTTGRGYH